MGWKDRDRRDGVELSVIFLRETEKAIQVRDGSEEIWIPKSVCRLDDDTELLEENKNFVTGDIVELSVEEWFAKKEGLI